MSLKDLCTIEYIPDLIEHGIDSFKIEGRMKQPAYVAAVTDAYRRYRDYYLEKGRENYRVKKDDLNRLMQAYQRRGYCNGYYYVHNGKNMISLERPKAEMQSEDTPNMVCQDVYKRQTPSRLLIKSIPLSGPRRKVVVLSASAVREESVRIVTLFNPLLHGIPLEGCNM